MVMALFYTPYMYLFTIGSLNRMDPALEESARVCGTGVLRTALRVTIPLSTPAMLSGAVIVFVVSMGVFGVPSLLGPIARISTLSTIIYTKMEEYPLDIGGAAALGSVLMVFTALGLFIQRKIIAPRSYVTVTGKGYRPSRVSLGPWNTSRSPSMFLRSSGGHPPAGSAPAGVVQPRLAGRVPLEPAFHLQLGLCPVRIRVRRSRHQEQPHPRAGGRIHHGGPVHVPLHGDSEGQEQEAQRRGRLPEHLPHRRAGPHHGHGFPHHMDQDAPLCVAHAVAHDGVHDALPALWLENHIFGASSLSSELERAPGSAAPRSYRR